MNIHFVISIDWRAATATRTKSKTDTSSFWVRALAEKQLQHAHTLSLSFCFCFSLSFCCCCCTLCHALLLCVCDHHLFFSLVLCLSAVCSCTHMQEQTHIIEWALFRFNHCANVRKILWNYFLNFKNFDENNKNDDDDEEKKNEALTHTLNDGFVFTFHYFFLFFSVEQFPFHLYKSRIDQ